MNPYMQFDPNIMASRMAGASSPALPNERSSPYVPTKGGSFWQNVAGAVTPAITKFGSEGPGGVMGKSFRKEDLQFAPGTNPGGQTIPSQAKVDTSKWDTDSYAAPGYTAPKAGNVLEGWDATKWADQNHQTPKYVVGRILSQYNNADPAQRAQAIADIQKAYPGATYDGKDSLTIPGVGTTDIFYGADAGIFRPQWLGEGGNASAAGLPPLPTAIPGNPGGGVVSPGMDSTFFQQLMDRLTAGGGQVAQDPNIMHAMTSRLRG